MKCLKKEGEFGGSFPMSRGGGLGGVLIKKVEEVFFVTVNTNFMDNLSSDKVSEVDCG